MSALDLSLGGMFIGMVLNIFFFGCSCIQAFFYFTRFREDTRFMRYFCFYLLIADTVNTVMICHSMYSYCVTGFGNLEYASAANWSFTSDPVLVSLIAISCQGFFAWRVHKLTHSWWLPGVAMAFSLASFIASILTSWQVSVVKYFEQFQSFQTYVILWLALASVADLLITGALVHTLSKSKTGFQATDQLVHKLVRSTIQTNALTTIFQVTDLVLFVSSNSTLHLIFNFPLGKLYINSLFSTLNARAYMRGWGSSASNGYSGSTDGIIDGTKQSSKSRTSQKIRPGRVSIGGNPISSRNARSPTSSSFVLSPVRKGFTPTQSQIQVTTIEERFEGQVDRDLELALQEEERAHQLTSPPVTPGFKKESNEGASKRYFLDPPTDNNIAGAFGISPSSNENSVTSHHHRSFDSHSHFDSDADFKA